MPLQNGIKVSSKFKPHSLRLFLTDKFNNFVNFNSFAVM